MWGGGGGFCQIGWNDLRQSSLVRLVSGITYHSEGQMVVLNPLYMCFLSRNTIEMFFTQFSVFSSRAFFCAPSYPSGEFHRPIVSLDVLPHSIVLSSKKPMYYWFQQFTLSHLQIITMLSDCQPKWTTAVTKYSDFRSPIVNSNASCHTDIPTHRSLSNICIRVSLFDSINIIYVLSTNTKSSIVR